MLQYPSYRRRLRSYARVRQDAKCRIETWLRKCVRVRSRNDRDPITLERIHPPIFKHVSPGGYVSGFTASALAAYIEASGDFQHPVTRHPFNACELRRLQNLLPLTSTDLCANRESLQSKRVHTINEHNMLDWLEQYAGNAVETMLGFAEYGASASGLQSTLMLFSTYLPELRHAVGNIATHSTHAYLLNVLQHQMRRVENACNSGRYREETCDVIQNMLERLTATVQHASDGSPEACHELDRWRHAGRFL